MAKLFGMELSIQEAAMFDWALFLLLVGICIPGIAVAVPGILRTLKNTVLSRVPEGAKIPPMRGLILVSILQSVVLAAAGAAAGTAVAHRVGLEAPFFRAIVSSGSPIEALVPQLLPAIIGGIGGAAIFIAGYYLVFRPRLDAQTVTSMENMRMELGFWSRILYGGIFEEVLTRWGLMSVLVWLGALVVGSASAAVVWTGIVVSGVLFGLGHLPSYLGAGCRRTPTFMVLIISLNLWGSMVFGYLFWQYGLVAAMLAHMLLHIIWLPFDRHYARKRVV